MSCKGEDYLSLFDSHIFFGVISDAADNSNCIIKIYSLSLTYYLKKCSNLRSSFKLNYIGCKKNSFLFQRYRNRIKSLLNLLVKDSQFRITSSKQIEIEWRTF